MLLNSRTADRIHFSSAMIELGEECLPWDSGAGNNVGGVGTNMLKSFVEGQPITGPPPATKGGSFSSSIGYHARSMLAPASTTTSGATVRGVL